MNIAVDVMGGDRGCEVVIDGLMQALKKCQQIETIQIVGNEIEISQSLDRLDNIDSRFQIVHASEVLSMDDKPVEGLRKKKNCSLAVAMDLVKTGKSDAIISPGNTGGVVAAAAIKLRTLSGIDRPGIAAVLPSKNKNFILLDAGANVEGKPKHLMHYAIMGDIYAREVLGITDPKIGLMSVGTEESKGNELTQETLRLCKGLDFNFIGNIEGHNLFSDELDVVVTNGFVGNVVLKSCEQLAEVLMGWLKDELSAGLMSKAGALLSQKAFRSLKKRIDPDNVGGAPLLGVNGTVTIAHGSASSLAIYNAICNTVEAVDHNINKLIIDAVAKANDKLPTK
ncbi:MAG: phosphate acyltransferase PlsX [Verrucomicrobiales bacterium]|nr:phosphate acyltransferase PlsX [Verrucomicrobiales bacterium]|tara:strand:+ start:2180 stop:3196 length:1017 start_codon:yes stop_codon:yes gene_type:complete